MHPPPKDKAIVLRRIIVKSDDANVKNLVHGNVTNINKFISTTIKEDNSVDSNIHL